MAQPATGAAALKKFMSRIKDIENEVVEKQVFALLYGDKGTGKTTAASALAQKVRGDGRILRLDSADGWVSLENIPALKRSTDNIERATLADLGVAVGALEQRKSGFEDYTVLIVDEVSSFYTTALHQYVREQMNVPDDQPLPTFGWDYYGAPQAALTNIFTRLQQVPDLHVVLVAHEQERSIKGDDKAKRMVPSMGSKLAEGLGQLSHVVARFESRSVQGKYVREVQSWPTRAVDAKSRIKSLDLKMGQTAWVNEVARWVTDSLAVEAAEPEAGVIYEDDETDDDEDFSVPDDEDNDEYSGKAVKA